MLKFEWDEAKTVIHAAKHGVLFDEAASVFGNPQSMTCSGLAGFVWVTPQRSPLAIRTTLPCGRELPSGILPDFGSIWHALIF